MSKFILDLSGLEPVSKNPYPFTPQQLQWLEALESGKYKQGQGFLCSIKHEYCCLGIICELAGAYKESYGSFNSFAFSYRGTEKLTGTLPYRLRLEYFLRSDLGDFQKRVLFPGLDYGSEEAKELAGFGAAESYTKGHTSLAAMNDCRMIKDGKKPRAFTFKEIAQYIRHDPWNVFLSPTDNVEQHIETAPPDLGGS